MAILFRPFFPVDERHWLPVLRREFAHWDFRVWPGTGDPAEIEYLITWRLFDGDRHAYPNLRALLSLSTGVDQYVGNPNFPENALLVRMMEEGLEQGMVEYVLGYVLRLHREHDRIDPRKKEIWGAAVPRFAADRTIGIMGLGRLGSACARALTGIGFRVRGWSRRPRELPGVESFAGRAALQDFLAGADILVCLLPLTADTRDVLNSTNLSTLPRGASIINVARGGLLVDDDLVALLDSGHLAMAVLDVFRTEPLPDGHPFWAHPNIHITPHIAAITSPETGTQHLCRAIEALRSGQQPAGMVDLARGY